MSLGTILDQTALIAGGFASPYVAAVLADLPRAYYRLGETVLTNGSLLADSSGNALSSTVRNGGSKLTSVVGNLTFDSNRAIQHAGPDNGDGLNLPDNALLNFSGQALSLEMWIKASASPGAFGCLAQKINGANGWIMESSNSGISFSYDADAHTAVYNATNPWDGSWHHLVLTWDGVNARYYIDSILKQTVPLAGTLTAGSGTVGKVFSDEGRASSGFTGILDEVAIYASVLTQARITAHYQAAITGVGATTAKGLFQGPNGIVGVQKAWSRVPDIIEPYTHVSFPGSGTIEGPETGERINVIKHHFPMRLFVQEWGPNMEQAVNDLIPFLERYKAAYPAMTTLNGNCLQAAIESYSTGVYTFSGTQWLIFEFTFIAWEVDTSILYTA